MASLKKDVEIASEIEGVHPWIRFWARSVDMVVALLFGAYSLGLLLASADPEGGLDLILGFGVLILWVLVEAGFLWAWGYTPGKALMGVKVRKEDGSKPSFEAALKRAGEVWYSGMGLGIPFISVFTMAHHYRKLKGNGVTNWDRKQGLRVIHDRIGPGSWIGLVCILLAYFLWIMLVHF